MICPYLSGTDLEGALVKVKCLEHECTKYVQILGKDSNTGADVNEWKCSDAWLPILLIENSQQGRAVAASVHSFRNVVDRGAAHIASSIQGIAQQEKPLEISNAPSSD